MEENIFITYAKNLTKQNFSTMVSVPIDNNVNIKTILNLDSYLFDVKLENGNGKAIMTGKLGVKVLYIDVDNILNTITDSTNFSQTFLDDAITSDCTLNVCDTTLVNNIISSDGVLKINVEISVSPTLYLNVGLNKKSNYENMFVKKTEIDTSTISNVVDAAFEHTINMQTKDNVAKILSYNAYFNAENVTAADECALVEGKLFCNLVYETNKEDGFEINEIKDCFNVKTEIPIAGLTGDAVLDLSFVVNKSKNNISTELEDGNCEITILNNIKVFGVAVRKISIDLINDMFSVDNEIELTKVSRDYNSSITCQQLTETITGEVSLAENETAIEKLLCNLNIEPEITNTYIKDNTLYIEGIVTSHISYLDENKTCQHKQTELPFVINTKIELTSIDCVHPTVNVCDCKVHVRRGTIIELEYLLNLTLAIYQKSSCEMVDNLTIGKAVDFSDYDYQIYIGKPDESLWELSKRIKIAPDDLVKYNKDLPSTLEGGEKIIIKR